MEGKNTNEGLDDKPVVWNPNIICKYGLEVSGRELSIAF